MIELKNVTKTISGKEVLRDINQTFTEGQCYLISGPNGCGKTMLLRMLCGLIKATEGEVNGTKNKSFGVIIENPEFFKHETVLYNLKYLAGIRKKIDVNEIQEWIKVFNLSEQKDIRFAKLSLGMKQRLALCQAFMENPDVILLDEPFNALDTENADILKNVIENEKNKGKIIAVAAHNVSSDLNDIFDYNIKMENGRIINEQDLKKGQ